MKDDLFQQLIGSLREAIAIQKGEGRPAREVRFPAPDTRAVRKRLGVTQLEFSRLIGVSLATLRNWEQGRRQPHGPARVLLLVAERHPDAVRQVVCEHRDGRAPAWGEGKGVLRFARPAVGAVRPQTAGDWHEHSQPAEGPVERGGEDERTSATA